MDLIERVLRRLYEHSNLTPYEKILYRLYEATPAANNQQQIPLPGMSASAPAASPASAPAASPASAPAASKPPKDNKSCEKAQAKELIDSIKHIDSKKGSFSMWRNFPYKSARYGESSGIPDDAKTDIIFVDQFGKDKRVSLKCAKDGSQMNQWSTTSGFKDYPDVKDFLQKFDLILSHWQTLNFPVYQTFEDYTLAKEACFGKSTNSMAAEMIVITGNPGVTKDLYFKEDGTITQSHKLEKGPRGIANSTRVPAKIFTHQNLPDESWTPTLWAGPIRGADYVNEYKRWIAPIGLLTKNPQAVDLTNYKLADIQALFQAVQSAQSYMQRVPGITFEAAFANYKGNLSEKMIMEIFSLKSSVLKLRRPRPSTQTATPATPAPPPPPTPKFSGREVGLWKIGKRVQNKKNQIGKIYSSNGNPTNLRITVLFDDTPEKDLEYIVDDPNATSTPYIKLLDESFRRKIRRL
jgi:hypothetical protein